MDFVELKGPGCSGLAVVVEAARGVAARPVVLETHPDAVVYLGAILDPAGEPWDWVEISVQETQELAEHLGSTLAPVTNPMLDRRWRKMVDGHARSDRASIFRGPWETEHPPPLFLAGDGRALADPPGGWGLCRDDELLRRHRLALFSETPHRYLVDDAERRFVPLSKGAPRSPATVEFDEVFVGLFPINREGGLMMVRRLPGLGYEAFMDFLGGRDFGDDPRELLRAPAVGSYKGFLEKNSHGQAGAGFIHGKSSQAERVAEILFLKLCALRGAFAAVSAAVASQKVPFLNLCGGSFGVSLAEPASGLPFLWNHRVSVCAASNVIPVSLGVGDEEVLLSCGETTRSIYRAARLGTAAEGIARVRIRKITPPDDGGLSVIEGTLQTDEPLDASRKDLLEINLRLGRGRRLAIYGNLMSRRPVAGEIRFLSFPQKVPADILDELERGGVQFAEKVDFRVIPRLGATCDLFSLGVLAVRSLLSSGDGSLAASLDDVLSLAHAYGGTYGANDWDTGSGQLADFVGSDKGAAWRDKLGPARVAEGISDEDAAAAIPGRLWWQVVGFVGRLFPGEMPGSFCKDFDDFEARAQEGVFTAPLETLDGLIEHCRTLLFGNPVASREILSVIRSVAARQR